MKITFYVRVKRIAYILKCHKVEVLRQSANEAVINGSDQQVDLCSIECTVGN